MAIRKTKQMLQIAVPKGVAETWHNVVKASGESQGDVFVIMFAGFLKTIQKGAKKNGTKKEKTIN